MTEQQTEKLLESATKLGPWAGALIAVASIIWALSTNISGIQSAQNFQGQEINQLIKAASDEQTLNYSISTQLAQLAQSVADIKANLPSR